MVPYGDDGPEDYQPVDVVVVEDEPVVVAPRPDDVVVEDDGAVDAVAMLSGPATGPNDLWWERAVIASVLQGYQDVAGLARVVTPQDFYQPMHEEIWQTIVDLWVDGVTPTVLMVMDRMGMAAHRLPRGPIYLSDLASSVDVRPAQAADYAERVRDCSIKRQIRDMGIRAMQLVENADYKGYEMLARLQGWFDRVQDRQTTGASDITSAFEKVIDIAENGQTLGIDSPWPDLDELLGGAFPGQLIVLGARPGVGKSIFGENWATHTARQPGNEVLFCSMEMSDAELTMRTMAHTAGVNLTRLRTGRDALTESDWQRIRDASATVTGAHITYVDEATQTITSITMAARQAHQRARRNGRRLALIVVDYVGLITASNSRHNARETINEATRGLKKLAKELDCAVLLLAQLNRQASGRANPQPVLTDLKESGSLEQDADVVLLLHEVETEDGDRVIKTGEVLCIVPKSRNGPTGVRSFDKWGAYASLRTRGA
jgi:replicative DNA helicase